MCGVAQADTLDHYLPKVGYEEYSVLSRNLVPACRRCNTTKRDGVAVPGGRYFHPYFDRLPQAALLVADTQVGHDEVTVEYRISSQGLAEREIAQVMEFHFHALGLSALFQAEAVQEIFDRAGSFYLTYADDGAAALQRQLTIDAVSAERERGPNNWKPALYKSLAGSSDFCDGGFQKILTPGMRIEWDFLLP